MTTMTSLMIRIGTFFFRYRNYAFPLIVLALCLTSPPPLDVMGSRSLGILKDVVALGLALAGLTLRAVVVGYAYIRRGGLNKRVHADDLVTGGIFALCRNPLYVGNVMIYSAIMLLHGSPWVVLTGIVLFVFIYQCIILAEEQFLSAKFGTAYLRYCATVPRWLPRLGRFRQATQGMSFNLRRVVLKDYSTMASTLGGMAVVELWKYTAAPTAPAHEALTRLLIAAIAIIACLTVAVSLSKRYGWLRERTT